MSNINKYTSKEVLNKVLLDSSGDAVTAYSHTTQEALNAALDATNNRLNISLKGGTIDGDVTITGDLTITGSSTYTYDEQIDGQLWLKDSTASSSTQGGHLRLFSDDGAAMAAGHRLGVIEFAGAEDASSTITVGARIEALAESTYTASENGSALLFYTTDGNASQSEQMRITSDGKIGIGCTPTQDLEIKMDTDKHMLFSDSQSETGYCPTIHAVNTAGSANVELGFRASELRFATGSAKRMVLDDNSRISLSNNDSGSGNTVFGKLSGDDLDSGGNYNSFFGENAGHAVTTGDANVAIGYGAMDVHTTGNYNIAIGYNAFGTAVGGSQNIAIGTEALGKQTESGTSSVRNIAIGDNTNYYNVTGEKNIMIGTNAGIGVDGQSHDNNVAVGDDSQYGITTGGYNVSLGNNTLYHNEDGSYNVAVGYQALRKLGSTGGTANNNIGIGVNTLENITADGIENCVAIGFEAMRGESGSTTGINGTVAVGYRSLDEITSGAGNTAVGFQSADLITTGSNNTVVGYDAEVSANSASNQTVVGKGATGQADNSVTLGNADVTAVYMAQDGHATINSGGLAVGYGTTTPDAEVKLKNTADNQVDIAFATTHNGGGIRYKTTGAGTTDQILSFVMGGGTDLVTIDNLGTATFTNTVKANAGLNVGSPTVTGFATNIKASTDVLSLEADGTGGPQLRLTDTSSSSDDDTFSLIDFSAKDSGGTQTIMNRIASTIPDNSAGTVDTALSIYAKSNNTLTETVRIGSSRLYLPQGQIGFPATQNASSDPNTLDDYEEAEHSATVTGEDGGSFAMSTNNTLRYTKIGRLVHIQGLLSITSDSSASGDIKITLPFTAGDGTDLSGRAYGSCQIYNHGGTISGNTSVEVVEGNNFCKLLEVEDNGDRDYLDEGDVDGAWDVAFDFTYSV